MTSNDNPAPSALRQPPCRSELLGCLVLTLGVWALTQGVFITAPYIASNDVCQQIYWMQRFQDADLYPSDIMNDYARSYVPWGVRGLYYAASSWMGAIGFSKILPAFSYVVSGLCLFLLGGRLGGRATAWASVIILWLYPLSLHTMTGGLARSFALPLTLLFLVACAWRMRKLMHLTLLLQALCIPYIFPGCALTVLVPCAWRRVARMAGRREVQPIFALNWRDLAVMAAAFLCIVAWQHQMTVLGFGPLPTAAQLAADPIYGAGGRFPIWPLFLRLGELFFIPPYELLGMQAWSSLGHALGVTLFYLCFLICLRRAGKKTAEFALYLWYGLACLCMYALAHALALRLFIPGRQLEYVMDIAVFLLFGLGLGQIWHALSARFPGYARRVCAVLLVGLAAFVGSERLHQRGLTDYSVYAPLYATARSLPKDALLAGHPMLMDAVHTFGQRNVLASRKLAHPWSLGYWARYEPRLRASLDALYAKDPKTLATLREQYGVSHLIAIDCQFTDSFIQGTPLFAPYNDYIRDLAARPGDFLLARDGPLPGVEIQPGVRIIALADLPAELPEPAPRPASPRSRDHAEHPCGAELFWRMP